MSRFSSQENVLAVQASDEAVAALLRITGAAGDEKTAINALSLAISLTQERLKYLAEIVKAAKAKGLKVRHLKVRGC